MRQVFSVAPSEPDAHAAAPPDATAAPPPAATASAASAAVAAAAMTAASATVTTMAAVAAVATMAAMADKLNHRRCVSLFVEDIERRQADIRDFLFTKSEVVTLSGVRRRRRYPHIRAYRYSGCAARQRQRQPSGSQHGEGFATTLSF